MEALFQDRGAGTGHSYRYGFFTLFVVAALGWGAVGSTAFAAAPEGSVQTRQPAYPGAGDRVELTRSAADFRPGTLIFAFMKAPGVWASLSKMVARIDRGLGGTCRAEPMVKPLMMGIHSTIEFPLDGHYPTRGLWTVRVKGSRCGNSRIFNMALMAQAGRPPKLVPLVPGETLTWKSLSLMDDVIKGAIASPAVTGREKGSCKGGRVINSRVTHPRNVDAGRNVFPDRWEELWSVSVCGGLVKVPVVFTVNGKSGKTEFFIKQARPR